MLSHSLSTSRDHDAKEINRNWTRVTVAVRAKPLSAEKGGGYTGTAGRYQVSKICKGGIEINGAAGSHTFAPKIVFDEDATQTDVYNTLLPELVDDFADGFDVNIMAFGQTGSGKTHFIFGPPNSMAEAMKTGDCEINDKYGILIRAGMDIFQKVDAMNKSGIYNCSLYGSMVELYFEEFLDLLNNKTPCSIDIDKHVIGATEIPVLSPRDVRKLAAAVELRSTSGTLMNDTSSRSHCITIIKLTRLEKSTGKVITSRFHLVDMMGSERRKGQNTAHSPSKSKEQTISEWEGVYSNMSLSEFRDQVVTVAKDNKHRKRVGKPALRTMKNTTLMNLGTFSKLLEKSLVGGARTLVMCTISKSPRNGTETYLSVKYGMELAALQTNPFRNIWQDSSSLLKTAEEMISTQTIALHRLREQRSRSGYKKGSSIYQASSSKKDRYEALREADLRKWTAIRRDMLRLIPKELI